MAISRRGFLATGAAFGAAWMSGALSACASAVPRVSSSAPGVARIELGPVTVTSVSDGHNVRPLAANFVRNAPLADVQAALRDAGLPTDRVEIPYTVFVVDVGSQRVLLDTGNGEFSAATSGKALENMTKAGIDPASVTAVVISHFHGDHINGLRNKAGALNFPNARIFVPAPEWNWWMDDARMAAAPEAMKGVFATARRVFGPVASSAVRFEPGAEVLPGLRSLPAFGHTAGHTVFVVEGGAQRVLYWGDTTNLAALFVRHPDWQVSFDLDADVARTMRRRLAEMVIDEKMLVAGFHLPGSAIGVLTRLGEGYQFAPVAA